MQNMLENMRSLAKYAQKDAANTQNMRSHAKMCNDMQIFAYTAYFRICNFANAIICSKICDMQTFANYAIACLLITVVQHLPVV